MVAGCCCCNTAAVQEGVNRAASLMNVTVLTAAAKSHADNNNGVWPATLDEVKDQIPNYDETIKNPLTGANPGYEYVPPPEGFDPATTIVIYQLRDGARDEKVEAGYADGQVRAPGTAAP
jgi:hypothetical protein